MARRLHQRGLESSARVERQFVRLYREPSSEAMEDARRAADGALQVFEEHADDFGQSRAWCLRAAVDWIQGQAARADDAWARAAVHARRADEQWQLFSILCWRASAALYGPTPVREAIEQCAAIREQVRTSAVAVAVTLHPLAALHAMLADFDTARSLIRQGNQILEEVGGTGMQSAHAHHEALVEMLAGRPEIAEERLRLGYSRLEEMGEKSLLSTSAAMLAQAIYAQGRTDEAERFCDVSEQTAAADDLWTQVLWRSVRGKILARQGRGEEGGPRPRGRAARRANGPAQRSRGRSARPGRGAQARPAPDRAGGTSPCAEGRCAVPTKGKSRLWGACAVSAVHAGPDLRRHRSTGGAGNGTWSNVLEPRRSNQTALPS